MHLATYIKAHVFHNFNAACELADEHPTSKNVKLLEKLSGVENLNANATYYVSNTVYQTQHERLIGKSIAPNIASIRSDKVVIDGYGEIISLSAPLKKRDFELLINNMVKPLKETPVKNTEEKIRTVAECTIDMACAIKKSHLRSDLKSHLLEKIKEIYLSGSFKRDTVRSFFKHSLETLGHDSSVINELRVLLNSIENKKILTKHNDNYYGRTFESIIAENIVNNPSQEMNRNVEVIKHKIITDFHSLSDSQKHDLIESIRDEMEGDPAIWRAKIPEVTNFLNKCTSLNFLKMTYTSSQLKHLLIMHLAVKYVKKSPGLKDIKNAATKLYLDVILPQRDLNRVPSNQEVSNRTGIKLNYQYGTAEKSEYIGVRPIDTYALSVDSLTEHNQKALTSERPIGIGMSGSSNILNYLFISLVDKYPGFDIDHARLLAASFLTYSGGHSINEAYTVFGYKDKKSFDPVSYSTLLESNDFTKKIINASYDKLIEEAMILN